MFPDAYPLVHFAALPVNAVHASVAVVELYVGDGLQSLKVSPMPFEWLVHVLGDVHDEQVWAFAPHALFVSEA